MFDSKTWSRFFVFPNFPSNMQICKWPKSMDHQQMFQEQEETFKTVRNFNKHAQKQQE